MTDILVNRSLGFLSVIFSTVSISLMMYKSSGERLHPVMKERILNYVRNNQKLELGGGIPGTHTEVRAANQMLNQLPDGFDVGNIQVSTYRLQPSKTGGQGASSVHVIIAAVSWMVLIF
ncbi:YwqJ-related putative deaminase [Shewanella algae]